MCIPVYVVRVSLFYGNYGEFYEPKSPRGTKQQKMDKSR